MFENIFKSHGHMSEKDLLLVIIQNQHSIMGQNALEFHLLNSKIDQIMSTQEELAAQLTDQATKLDGLTTQVVKIGTETKGLQDAIAALNGEIGNQDVVSPALQAAADAVTAKLASLTTAVQAVDDSVPDAPAPVPPTV